MAPRCARTRRHRPVPAASVVVHPVAGDALDGDHTCRRPAGGLLLRSHAIRRQTSDLGAADRSLRAPDRGRGLGGAGSSGTAQSGRGRPQGVDLGDPPRPRVVQLRGHRAHGRGVLEQPRSVAGGSGPRLRSVAVAGVPRGDVASPASRGLGGELDRLPLHVHELRRRVATRRAGIQHARGRDLHTDNPTAAARHRSGVGHRAVRRSARGAARVFDLRPSPGGHRPAEDRSRDEPTGERKRPAVVPRRQPRVHGAVARCTARRPGAAVVRLRLGPVLVALQRPRVGPAGECPLRPADRGRSQLADVRAGRDGDRVGDRWAWPPWRSPARARA